MKMEDLEERSNSRDGLFRFEKEHHVEDIEVIDVTEVDTLYVQRRAHRFTNQVRRCDMDSNQHLAPAV